MGVSGGKAQAAAFHADLQTVCRLAARVDDAAVHVTGQVAVATFLWSAAAAAEARVVGCAGAASGAVQHDVAQCEELTEQTGQDAVDTAIWTQQRKLVNNKKISLASDAYLCQSNFLQVKEMCTNNHGLWLPHHPEPLWGSGSCWIWSYLCSSDCWWMGSTAASWGFYGLRMKMRRTRRWLVNRFRFWPRCCVACCLSSVAPPIRSS